MMIKITFINDDGTERVVDAESCSTVMEAALLNNVPGIVAECGGSCSCGTCQIYVDEPWGEKFEESAPEEQDLLEYLEHVRPCSRLSCQLVVTTELDGMVVHTPPSQQQQF